MSFKVYDFQGNESTYAWLRDYFGSVVVEDIEPKRYAVSELRARDGDAAIVVKVEGVSGAPIPGVTVAFYWPDAPNEPSAGWYDKCVKGDTNSEGCVGFGMGGGAYYQPPAGGPHAVWVFGDNESQMVDGLGMVWATNHEHVNVTFREYTAPAERYVLAKTAVNGSIEEHPAQPQEGYLAGTTVQLHAVPDIGYHFVEWNGDLVGSQNPGSLLMDNDKSIVAVFERDYVPPPSEHVRFYNIGGVEQDAAWAEHYFGTQEIYSPASSNIWRVVELIEENDTASPNRILSVVVVDGAGDAISGVPVRIGPIDVEGVVLEAVTNEYGVASFQMGDEFLYSVPGQGSYGIAVAQGDSEVYKSVGVVQANPKRWLNVTFMLFDEGPEYPDEELRVIIGNIDGMLESGGEYLANLANIKAVLQSLLK